MAPRWTYTKYEAKCRDCGCTVARDAFALYDSDGERGKKIRCRDCGTKWKTAPQPESEEPVMRQTLAEEIERFRSVAAGEYRFKLEHNSRMSESEVNSGSPVFRAGEHRKDRGTIKSILKCLTLGAPIPESVIGPEVLERIQTALGSDKIRSMARCEDDGELISREHLTDSDMPYRRRKRVRKPMPILEVESYFSANCHTSAETIQRGSELLFCIVQAIEAAGVQVGLTNCMRTENLSNDKKCPRVTHIKTRIKAPNEYTNPAIIAAVHTPEYFRSVGFTSLIEHCDRLGFNVSYGLGRSANPPTSIEAGVLRLTLKSLTNENVDAVLTKVTEALGITV